ncbi:MAG: hypothetical protein ACI8WM_000687 [Burkholderiaceae bacterium]|jgi:hypothetical protein
MTLSVSPAELEKIAFSLVSTALNSRVVARLGLDNGLSMFAYPETDFVIVGIGYQRDQLRPGFINTVLKRRHQAPARFAQWLPAQFADGSFFVLLRIGHDVPDVTPSPPEAALDNAVALLSP